MEVLMVVAADLVTETDKAVEKMVLGELKAKYPGFEYDPLLEHKGQH